MVLVACYNEPQDTRTRIYMTMDCLFFAPVPISSDGAQYAYSALHCDGTEDPLPVATVSSTIEIASDSALAGVFHEMYHLQWTTAVVVGLMLGALLFFHFMKKR